MHHGLTVARVSGIPIEIQASWPPAFLFVLWTLSVRFFPRLHPDQPLVIYWVAGSVASILLFSSLLAHEFGHATVARGRGLPVHRVTLFILGGAVEIDLAGCSPGDEFWLSLAGPAVSMLLGIAFGIVWWVGRPLHGYVPVIALYFALCNVLLGLFNLLPGLPLDGGRMARAFIWHVTGDQRRATIWAGWLGRWLGGVVFLLGGMAFFRHEIFLGVWFVAVGLFLMVEAYAVQWVISSPRS